MTIRPARFPEEAEVVRELLREYARVVDAPECFITFENELAALPSGYDVLLVAEDRERLTGIAALRAIADGAGEMKRLYVRPEARGTKLGLALTGAILEEARSRGYASLRLDTLPKMERAIAMYRALGFREIAPYGNPPSPGALFFEIDLH